MKYLKHYKSFESFGNWSSIDELEDDVQEIFLELEDSGLQINYDRIRKDVEIEPDKFISKTRTDIFLEVYIKRPYGSQPRVVPSLPTPPGGKYSGDLFFWYEIKDTIIRLTEWYYSEGGYEPIDKNSDYRWEKDKSPLRFFGGGIEMFIGNSKEEDFKEIGDYISFSNFRIIIKL
jgi:hypothetical protein